MRTDLVQTALMINIQSKEQVQGPVLPRDLLEIWTPDSGIVLIPAGATVEIYRFEIEKTQFGVVRALAWNYYWGDSLELKIDNISVYDKPITFSLGEYPNTVEHTLKPFSKSVVMTGTNGTSDKHFYGVMCKGYVASKSDKDILLSLVSRGVI